MNQVVFPSLLGIKAKVQNISLVHATRQSLRRLGIFVITIGSISYL